MDLREAYRVLEVDLGASREDVREARNVLVRVWHPDRHQGDPTLHQRADSKLKQINAAYEAIDDAGFPSRASFDEPAPTARVPRPTDPPPPSRPPPRPTSSPPPPPPRPSPSPSESESPAEASPPRAAPSQPPAAATNRGVMTLGAFVVGAVLIGVYANNENKSDDSNEPRYRPTYEPTSRTERAPSYSYQPPQPSEIEATTAPAQSESAPQNAFTLGSSRDDVTAAQGTPTSIDKSMGETWWYGGSRIEFRGGRVFEWNASASTRLNSVLRPTNQTIVEAAKRRGTFTLGGSKDEVLSLEGTPTTVDRSMTDTWWYGANRIEYRNGRVSGWNTSPMERPLHAVLLPRNEEVAAAAKARGNYGPNATKDEVLAVEGTPSTVDLSLGETWWYGAARIEFRNGRIRDFDASPMSPLHIKMSRDADIEVAQKPSAPAPSRRIPYERAEAPRESSAPTPSQTFGVGSSTGDVLAAQGKPQRVIDVDSATEIWQYGSSTVTIGSGRVREYSNLGSLNVR